MKTKNSLKRNEYNKKQFINLYFWILCKYISQVVAYMLYLLLFIEEIRDVLVGY